MIVVCCSLGVFVFSQWSDRETFVRLSRDWNSALGATDNTKQVLMETATGSFFEHTCVSMYHKSIRQKLPYMYFSQVFLCISELIRTLQNR